MIVLNGVVINVRWLMRIVNVADKLWEGHCWFVWLP